VGALPDGFAVKCERANHRLNLPAAMMPTKYQRREATREGPCWFARVEDMDAFFVLDAHPQRSFLFHFLPVHASRLSFVEV
jgi:hypothetical protein